MEHGGAGEAWQVFTGSLTLYQTHRSYLHASALASTTIEERLNADMTQTELLVTWSSGQSTYSSSVAVDAAGNTYVVGGFSGSYFNVSGTIYNPYNGGGGTGWNNFLIKVNSAGGIDWVNVRNKGGILRPMDAQTIDLTSFSATKIQIIGTDQSDKTMVGD